MYFSNFPNMYYSYTINDESVLKIVKDITQNVRLQKQFLELITLYDEYDLQEGDTPDIVAAKYYGNANYHWIVMMTNEKYDYINDWPMPYNVLNDYIRDKYNKFNATSWSYTVAAGKTTITAVCPNHGITSSEVTTNMTNPVTIENVYVTTSSATTGEKYTTNPTGIQYTGTVTSVTTSNIVIEVDGTLTSTVPNTWPAGSHTWSPVGGMTLWTTNRESLIKYWQRDGYIVDDGTVGAEPITYYDYETKLNDSKRRIKLISPGVINEFINELQQLIG